MSQKVSIIVPIHNAEKYLEKCISSIVEQIYENIEIILIDDGSTDKSYEICCKFKTQDPRIICITQENMGVSLSRNKGINLSSGDYIMFVDADDWIESEYVNIMINNIGENDIIASSFTEETESQNTIVRSYKKIENNVIIDSKSKLFSDCIDQQIYTYLIWGKLYKKEIIGSTKFINQPYSEDAIFIRDIFCKCSSVKTINYSGYHYRLGSGVTNNTTRDAEKMIGALKMLDRTYKLCLEQQLEVSYISLKNMIFETWYGTIRAYIKSKKSISRLDYDYIKEVYINYHLNNTAINILNRIKMKISIMEIYLKFLVQRRK